MTYGTYGNRAQAAGTPAAGRTGWNGRSGNSDGLTPMQMWRRLYARRSLLTKTGGLAFFGVAVAVFMATPQYTGAARILVEAPPSQIVNPLDTTTRPVADREKVASEIQVLLSRALAERAIAALKLEQNPEFNPNLPNSSRLDRLKSQLFGVGSLKETIVGRYYDRLRVYQVGTSRVIAVDFSSESPRVARDAANKVAELYIEDQQKTLLDLNARSRSWLSDQIEELRTRVSSSEARVEEFRAKSGLIEGTGSELQTQELTELNSQLSAARAARAEAQARVASLQRLVGNRASTEGVDSVLEVLQSALIQQLRASEVQLQRELSEMSQTLLPSHPNMIRKEAELADLGGQIRTEMQKVIAGLRNQARFSAARETSLQQDLDRLKTRQAAANRDQIALRALEREATADRNLLELFLGRFAEVSARGDISLQDANARIISPALLPESPSFPRTAPLLALGLLIACGAGLSAVVMSELTGQKVRYARDVEAATGLPVLAVVPSVKRPSAGEDILPKGDAYGEAIRTLHASLNITPSRNQRGRMILVTSSAREEGRTTTAMALARSTVKAGLRALVIDADFENPKLSRKLGFVGEQLGFSDLLAGRAGYEHVISADPASSVQIIPAGREYQASALASPRFQMIVDGLVRAYDVVIVDCAPLARSDDPHALARIADQCIYVVRWNATDRESVMAGLRRLAISGMRNGGVGMVLTRAERAALA
jgi:capsular exopolysaccharide synthesis family protein